MYGCTYFGRQQELWDGGYVKNLRLSAYILLHRYKGGLLFTYNAKQLSTYILLHKCKGAFG